MYIVWHKYHHFCTKLFFHPHKCQAQALDLFVIERSALDTPDGLFFHQPPQQIDDAMVTAIEHLIPFAPNHLPQALAAIDATRTAFPALPQVACFDTAFHRTMPPVAQRYPLPSEFEQDGVIRYGFHGLSYASVVEQLGERIPPRTIVAQPSALAVSKVMTRSSRSA